VTEHLRPLIARALRSLDERRESRGDAITFLTTGVRRGVYAGSAGLALSRLTLDPAISNATRDAIVRGLARTLTELEPEPDYLDGVGSELDLLVRLAPRCICVSDIARALLPRLEARLMHEPCPTESGLHGGIAGRLLTLSCVSGVARVAPNANLVATLARRLGDSFLLTPRGLALASHGARRPLVGLTHGATGVAWTLERLSSEGHLSRRLAASLRAYVLLRAEEHTQGWPDDRDDDQPTRATTAYCHGSFGIMAGSARGAEGRAVRKRAIAHLAAEAEHGGNGSLSLCHGDASTLLALQGERLTATARTLACAIEDRLAGETFEDLGSGLFVSSIGALVVLARGAPSKFPPVPWLPSSSVLRPLGLPLEEVVPAALRAAMPVAGERIKPHERTVVLDAFPLGSLVRSPRASCPPHLADGICLDVEQMKLHWRLVDDAAVARRAHEERARGRALARAVASLPGTTSIGVSSRVLVRASREGPRLLVHTGARVESVEIDAFLFQTLAAAAAGTTLSTLEHLVRSAVPSLADPRGAIGALFALGYLVTRDPSLETITWNKEPKAS